jgi:Fic family protein
MQTYRLIEDLPGDWHRLAASDLTSLAPIWAERLAKLKGSDADLRRFNDRLRRKWAIETGILEGLYSIDRGATQLLIEHGIVGSLLDHGSTTRPAEHVIDLIRDQEDSLKSLFDFVAGQRRLTPAYIREVHHSLTRSQEWVDAVDTTGKSIRVPLLRGDWKVQPNNPTRPDGEVHAYCPPVHVASEVDRLVAMHAAHVAEGVPPDVEAAWLHHRFTQIHPFQDGNGRVARALASLVFVRSGWFPLVVDRGERGEYIAALEQADGGNLGALVDLFSRTQRQLFHEALSLALDVQSEQPTLQGQIAAAAAVLQRRQGIQSAERQEVFALSALLVSAATERLEALAREIGVTLGGIDPSFDAAVASATESTDHYYRQPILNTATHFGYYANLSVSREWVRMQIRDEGVTDMVLSFHGLGRDFVGVLAVSAFVEHRDLNSIRDENGTGLHPVCSEIFQFAYNEKQAVVLERFGRWLAGALMTGLEQWRRRL